MKTLIYVALLASCAVVPSQPPQCITRCGMYSEVECGRMQTAEDVAGFSLGAFVQGWRMDTVCTAVSGWSLRVHRHTEADEGCRGWRYLPGLCVLGYTDALMRTVWVADTDVGNNAYTHEVVHVVDLQRTGKAGHCGWQRRGASDGVFIATGSMHVPEEESDCAQSFLK